MCRNKHKRNKNISQGTNNPNGTFEYNETNGINVSDKPVEVGTLSDSPALDATHESDNKKPLDNIKFIAYVLSMIVTLFVALTNFVPYFESRRGKFVAVVHGDEVTSPYIRTSLVYFDEDSIDFANFDFFPIITNPTKHPLDVLVKYMISPNLPGVSITDYYDAHEIRQSIEVTNKDNKEETLYPSIPMPSTFSRFVMKDNEQVTVSLQATYKRMKKPFLYKTHIYTKKIVEENESNRIESIFNDVEHFLVSNNIDTCNIYILDSGTMFKHENFICSAERLEILSVSNTNKEYEIGKKEGRPWYIYLVGIVLGIIYLAVTCKLVLWFMLYDSKAILNFEFRINKHENFRPIFGYRRNSAINLLSIIIRIIISVLIIFVLQFVIRIIIIGESDLSWTNLASMYVMLFGMLLISLIFDKVHKPSSKLSINKLIAYIIWIVLLYILFYILNKHGIMPFTFI